MKLIFTLQQRISTFTKETVHQGTTKLAVQSKLNKRSNNMRIRATFLVLIDSVFTLSLAYEMKIYYTSTSSLNITFTVNDTSCANLPVHIKRVYKAEVDKPYACLQFYDDTGCKGDSIQISTGRFQMVYNIDDWNFHNKTRSIQLCPDPCVPDLGDSIPIIENKTNISFPIFSIQMFSLSGFKGTRLDVIVNGCTHLDKSWGIVGIPLSLRIPRARCVLLFYNNIGGNNGDDRDCLVSDLDYNIFEFQDRDPSLEDIGIRILPPKFIKALSPCACLSRMNDSSIEKQPDFPRGENIIVLYSAPNFEGESLEISLDFVGCKNLKDYNISREWEGLAQSMFLANNCCVVVFREHDCPPNAQMKINISIPLLSLYQLGRKIRSLRICDKIVKANENVNTMFYYLIPLSTLSTLLALGLIIVQIYMRKRFRNVYKTIKEKLSEREVRQFMEGLGLELGKEPDMYHQEIFSGPAASRLSADLLAENLPYDNQLEIPLAQLKYDSNCPIGSGEFGVVFKGILTQQDKRRENTVKIQVAIKTTKPNTNAEYLRVLLKEVKVMMFVGKHQYIVSLLGCSTVKLRDGILLVVLEFCGNGSLERYIKANRANFVNLVQRGKLVTTKEPAGPESEDGHSHYMKCILGSNNGNKFNIHLLLTWSIEIAKGMEYLASKRVIHGDLSARNILLTECLTAKVSDFGLSRKMYSYTHYTKNGDDPLPWRWLALESLKNLQFSSASDAWSFGILLWEIFTLCEQPYPGVPSLTNNFIINLEEGLRPTLPQFATSDIYNVMSSCWNENAKSRPSFSCLITSLQEEQDRCKIAANGGGVLQQDQKEIKIA